jgi:hypothetical protein
MKRFFVRWLTLYLLLNGLLFLTGCATGWVTEASNIISALTPAIQAALLILASVGAALPAGALDSVQNWGQQATQDLQNVVLPLIQAYNAATEGEQPGILIEIKTALTDIVNKLQPILAAIHVTDVALDAKITLVVNEIADEFSALVALIPVLQGNVKDHDEMQALIAKVKTAKQFKRDFNKAASAFGKQYEIK